ncbi:2,5-diamino-6-(ribosylamino)-4(3H)-pyrimidinone 5'-phosphate reductase [Methanophagales archaeon]|nr:2,5-diamino-6-(ribosylamino)-4(3H)-pyrimidinone 5'-phosphate reductase [Methanophagales archaeon]
MERPFVFINAAMSADGKISTVERVPTRISGREDRDRVDALKAGSDAIMVGIGTVMADNPSLTVKSRKRREDRKQAERGENPIRIVVDSNARTPIDAEILNKGSGKRIIAVSKRAIIADVDRLGEKAEINVCGREEVDLKKLLDLLWQRGVKRLMVEGGATLNWSLVSQGLVDEIYIYIGNIIIGGEHAPTLVDGTGFVTDMAKLELFSVEKMDNGIILQWRVRN